MSATPNPVLDAQELLHLAILDSQATRHDLAIAKLKIAAGQEPGNAKVQYLLAAEYAEIGLFDRAIEGMTRAVTLDPTLWTAHFQLGLLHYTQGRLSEATANWLVLDKLDGGDPLRLFKDALLKLNGGDKAGATEILEQAALNAASNAALTRDIQRVLANVRERAASPGSSGAPPPHMVANRYGEAGED